MRLSNGKKHSHLTKEKADQKRLVFFSLIYKKFRVLKSTERHLKAYQIL